MFFALYFGEEKCEAFQSLLMLSRQWFVFQPRLLPPAPEDKAATALVSFPEVSLRRHGSPQARWEVQERSSSFLAITSYGTNHLLGFCSSFACQLASCSKQFESYALEKGGFNSSLGKACPENVNILIYLPFEKCCVQSGMWLVGLIKLALEAGKATPAPPVGPALGSKGVNIMAFCKD
ncbi:hypothetical protein SAY87_032000 [Trapa incisa]|uniref:Large ribosomal subunit protein uL11 N-terminal domain-containing protein n=1 Tax=Trapa incisa TaxID=236973 RepID=A0AAN7QNW0_9MYRT|nr:hypothetical protein SAY87_032000 [Trapa incisa]